MPRATGGDPYKDQVFREWVRDRSLSAEQLAAKVNYDVQVSRIRSWIVSWSKGKFVPARSAGLLINSLQEEVERLRSGLGSTTDDVEADKLRDKIQTLNEEIEEHKTKVEELKLAVKEAEENKPRTIILKRWDGKKKTLKAARHYAYEEVLLLASRRKNIFLPGPAGCGKSHLAKQVAKDLDLNYYSINCSAGMSEGHLTGRLLPMAPQQERLIEAYKWFAGKKIPNDAAAILASAGAGSFEYIMVSYVKAYKYGGLFLADELDAADSNVLLSINTSLSNGYLVLPNNPNEPEIPKHKDFVFIGAANTFGRGADRLYVGRNQLDEAYLDRFKIGTVEMDYDPQLERTLCPDDDLRERLQGYRQRVRENRLERIVSSRFLEEAYEMKTECGWDDEKIDSKLFSGWTQDEIKKARGEFVSSVSRRW